MKTITVWDQISNQVNNKINIQFSDPLSNQVMEQVGEQLRSRIHDQMISDPTLTQAIGQTRTLVYNQISNLFLTGGVWGDRVVI